MTEASENQLPLDGIEEAPQYPLSVITEYNATELALADFKLKYQNLVFNVGTPAGLAEAKSVRFTLRSYRTSLEKLRKEIKEPALQRCRDIDSEAKRITAQIEALEDPIDAQIKAEENRREEEKAAKAKAEAARVSAIHENIELIRNHGATASTTAAELTRHIARLQSLTLDEADYHEFTALASLTREKALTELSGLLAERQLFDAEQAALLEERKRQEAERRRLAEEEAAQKERIAAAEAEIKRQQEELRQREAALLEKAAKSEPEAVAEKSTANPTEISPGSVVDDEDDLPWGDAPAVEPPVSPTSEKIIGKRTEYMDFTSRLAAAGEVVYAIELLIDLSEEAKAQCNVLEEPYSETLQKVIEFLDKWVPISDDLVQS